MKIRNNSKLTAGLTGVLMILFIMLTGGTALAAGTGSTGSSITAQTVYTYEDDAMKVTATLSDGSAIPAGSTLKVDTLTDQTTDENVKALYTDAKTMIDNQAANEKYTLDSFAAYNIYFKKDDNTYVPSSGTMTLEVTYKAANAPEAYTKSTAGSKAVVVYQKTQIKDILGNSTYILSNLGTAKDADQKDIISKKELDESGSLKALTFKESTYLPVILAWTENNAQAAANGAVTPTPTAAPSVTAAPTAEPSTTADENAGNTTVTPTAEPSATAAPSTTVENGNDSGTDKADAANNTVNKDDFNLGDNQTTNESLVDGSTGSGILTDNTAKGVTSTDANGKKIRTYTYKSDDVTVTVTADDTSALPDGAVLKVTPQKITEEMQSKLDAQAIAEQKAIKGQAAYDISFVVNGVEVEPAQGVKVSITSSALNEGDDSTVYHVNDATKELEKINNVVTSGNNVQFDADKFSTYVIIKNPINATGSVDVTINRYNQSESNALIYSTTKTIAVGEQMGVDYDLDNWTRVSITKSVGGAAAVEADASNFVATANTIVNIYYTPIDNTTYGKGINNVKFYDYTINYQKWTKIKSTASGKGNSKVTTTKYTVDYDSFNSIANYSLDNTDATKTNRLTAGTQSQNILTRYTKGNDGYVTVTYQYGQNPNKDNQREWYYTVQNSYTFNQNWSCTTTDGKKWEANSNHDDKSSSTSSNITTGLLKGLDMNGNPVFNYDEPGFFNNTSTNTRTVLSDYNLVFDKKGNTYTLSNVYHGSANVATAGNAFFPLDAGYTSNKNSYTNPSGTWYEQTQTGHNYYFGMRYDVPFTIGDYVGPLTYSFTGDDDMWVVLTDVDNPADSHVIVDVGGIHPAQTQTVDLWDVLNCYQKNGDDYVYDSNNKKILNTEAVKAVNTKNYKLTVLYMERGAGASNCQMDFTLPNAKIASVSQTPTADLTIRKTDSNATPLKNATFKLVNDSDSTNVKNVTSGSDGEITFNNLEVGTYTLSEIDAPAGYVKSTDTWKVKVTADSTTQSGAVAKLYDSTGNTENTAKVITNKTQEEKVKEEVTYNKTSTVANWEDRTYNIHLDASSLKDVKASPYDIVLVLDTSGSMKDAFSTFTEVTTDTKSDYSGNTYKCVSGGTYYYKTASGIYQKVILNDGFWSWDGQYSSYYYKSFQYKDTGTNTTVTKNVGDLTLYTKSSSSDTKLGQMSAVASNFITKVKEINSDSRVAVVTFNSTNADSQKGYTGTNIDQYLKRVGTPESLNSLNNAINDLTAGGATDSATGLSKAHDVFTDTKNADPVTTTTGRKRMVVFLTDGVPTVVNGFNSAVASSAVANASILKNTDGATVYSFGIFDSTVDDGDQIDNNGYMSHGYNTNSSTSYGYWGKVSEVDTYMQGVSSGSGYYQTANSATDLSGLFDKVTEEMNNVTGTITDVVDSRFELTEASSAALTKAGATVVPNSDGTTTITWSNAKIAKATTPEGATTATPGWSADFTIQAKSNYIGGNNVDTNGAASGITVEGNTASFDQPKVNVKSEFTLNPAKDTIFWGDTVQSAHTRDDSSTTLDSALKAKLLASTIVKYNLNGYAVNADDFTLTYYSDETCNNQITDLAGQTPENLNNTYYVKATYKQLGASTQDSYEHSGNNISGNASTIGVNSTLTQGPAIYIVHVVKGQISITKNINKQYSNINAINANQTFVFKIQRYNDSDKSTSPTDTFYETINFNANDGTAANQLTKTAIISQLKKGYYEVTEETSWAPKYEPQGSTVNGNNVGTYKGIDSNTSKVKFTGMEINSTTNASNYAQYAINVDSNGNTSTTVLNSQFTNNLKSGWNWLSDTAAAVNQFTKTSN